MNEKKITACYERLSHDDQVTGESNSIKNQKAQLEEYAKSHDFKNIVHFTDDGINGTRFGADRPAFSKLMNEIESGLYRLVFVKTLAV
jgi:DNA invertase Pin-like site-specific DNA recombinase